MPLSLDVQKIDSAHIQGYRAQVMATAYGKKEDTPVAITPECVTLSQIEREVARLQEELKAILVEARAAFAEKAG